MTQQHPVNDPDFLTFLRERLVEERAAAAARLSADESSPVTERGIDLLEEILDGLEAGNGPDPMSCDLLVLAYADHPSFRPEWNRWRHAARTA